MEMCGLSSSAGFSAVTHSVLYRVVMHLPFTYRDQRPSRTGIDYGSLSPAITASGAADDATFTLRYHLSLNCTIPSILVGTHVPHVVSD
jgi:hypothetical protein